MNVIDGAFEIECEKPQPDTNLAARILARRQNCHIKWAPNTISFDRKMDEM